MKQFEYDAAIHEDPDRGRRGAARDLQGRV